MAGLIDQLTRGSSDIPSKSTLSKTESTNTISSSISSTTSSHDGLSKQSEQNEKSKKKGTISDQLKGKFSSLINKNYKKEKNTTSSEKKHIHENDQTNGIKENQEKQILNSNTEHAIISVPNDITSEAFPIAILSIAGIEEPIFLNTFKGEEEISEPYKFEITFFVKDFTKIKCESLLNKEAQILFEYMSHKRYFNGIIIESKISSLQNPDFPQFTLYKIVVSHELYLLTKNKNSKLFVKQSENPALTVVDIIEEILSLYSIKYEIHIPKNNLLKKESIMQFDESDLNFISRLCEDEGVFYFFEFKNNERILIFSNTNSYFLIPYSPNIPERVQDVGHKFLGNITKIEQISNVIPNAYKTTNYNFTNTNHNLKSKTKTEHGNIPIDVYEINQNFLSKQDGEKITNIRAKMLDNEFFKINMESNYAYLSAGYRFKIENSLSKERNKEYYVTKIYHTMKVTKMGRKADYGNKVTAYLYETPYAPPIKKPKPKIYGNLLGKVVGGKNDVVYKDKYNRIKVFFFFDIYQTPDEKSSAWVRVAENFTGSNFGTVFTPRVGSEVILSFLNGDPDQPIVIGSLYNANNIPFYNDSNITVSSIRTQSFGNKHGFNEISFDDKENEEKIYTHAERDLVTDVKKDLLINIEDGNKVSTIQKGNSISNINDGDKLLSIKQGDFLISLDNGNLGLFLEKGDISLSINGNHEHTIEKTLQINADKLIISTKNGIEIHTDDNLSISSNKNISINAKKDVKISANDIQMSASKSISTFALENIDLISKMKNITLKAMSEVNISSLNTSISSTMRTSLKGTVQISLSSALINIKATGICNIGGSLTKLG